MIEQENNQRLLKSRVQVPDKIEVDGAMRIPCHLYPDCKTVFIKALGWFSIIFNLRTLQCEPYEIISCEVSPLAVHTVF